MVRAEGSDSPTEGLPVVILLQTGEAGKPLPVLAVFGDVPRDYQLRFYGCKILYR